MDHVSLIRKATVFTFKKNWRLPASKMIINIVPWVYAIDREKKNLENLMIKTIP